MGLRPQLRILALRSGVAGVVTMKCIGRRWRGRDEKERQSLKVGRSKRFKITWTAAKGPQCCGQNGSGRKIELLVTDSSQCGNSDSEAAGDIWWLLLKASYYNGASSARRYL